MDENKTLLFFDTEFTGLTQYTELISIAIIGSIDNKRCIFYAEFNDYDQSRITDWLRDNVINNLKFNDVHDKFIQDGRRVFMKGDKSHIKLQMMDWLKKFDSIDMWSDCLAYDWVLFNNIFGTAFDIPKNIYYIPFDICTLMKIKGIDPDVNREEFANVTDLPVKKHNALYDAYIIEKCYKKLIRM